MTTFLSGIGTKATFHGGTEHGKTYDVWATREILVVIQAPPVVDAEQVKKMDLKTLMSGPHPKPVRQVYELVTSPRNLNGAAEYRLASVEAP